ncbi:hypothetical protein QCA50_006387 [Cerrena zonata]|uniref:RNA polymerase II-associated protein 3 n=1 Tax=Cerrena zonata TaxID=2478898 RepID=A0AAW0GHP1_9APHY
MSSEAAQIAKDKGNASFKSGDFATAVGHYSAAVVADSRNPTYPLNRAAAYLKLGKNEDAERDCSRVIELDSKNVKAWFRRAQARVALEKFDDALTDLKRAGVLEPSNQDVKKEIAKTEDLKKRKVVEGKQKSARRTQLSQAAAPNPPPHPLRRRVPITIVEPEAGPSSPKPEISPAPQSSPIIDDLLKPVSSRLISSPAVATPKTATPPTPPQAPSEPRPTTTSGPPPRAKSPPTAPLPKVSGGIFRPNGNHTIFGSKNNDKASNSTSAASSPTSLFTFMRIWETFKQPEQRWAFIQQIAPASLPAIFKSSLEASTLISILQTFQAVLQNSNSIEDVKTVKEYMTNLPRVPRWSTIILFLGTDERTMIRDIWDRLPKDESDTRAREAWGLGSS